MTLGIAPIEKLFIFGRGDKMQRDIKALWKSITVNLAVTAIWYAAEYEQFGTLQWDRWGDNIIGVLYILILWWMFRKIENPKD